MHFPAARSPENCGIPGRSHNLNLPKKLFISVLVFFLMFSDVKAQPSSSLNALASDNSASNFQASLAVVIGILSIMFFLTFILLVYAKFCHRASSTHNNLQLIRSSSRFSGIDKTVIESLPFFRFSSLKGSREGLECSVCLSKFEDIEVLRLLPKCKHAFHIDCVDQWLEKHSSCPLCRQKISTDDLAFSAYSNSLRQDSNLEIFVEREEDHHHHHSHRGSSRFSERIVSFRKFDKGKKQEELLIQESEENEEEFLHKFNHKIIVSDVVLKNRWSSVSSSDLMFLNSEMINANSSNRFSSLDSKVIGDGEILNTKEKEREKVFGSKVSRINQSELIPISGNSSTAESRENLGFKSKVLNSTEKRSMSEITVHPRFTEFSMKNSSKERKLWLPIAQRTVEWFANRERRSPESQNTRKSLNV